MADLMELAPRVLSESEASCGCSFVLVRRQLFSPRDGWHDGVEIVVVPCGERHVDLAREVGESAVGAVSTQAVIEVLAAEMSARVEGQQ